MSVIRLPKMWTGIGTILALLGPSTLAVADAADDMANIYTVGVSIVRPGRACPIFIWSVTPRSPADLAGIIGGDRLLAIDGTNASQMDLAQASKLIRSDMPGRVALKLSHHGQEYEVAVKREKLSFILSGVGMKLVDNSIVPLDTIDLELEYRSQFDPKRIAARVFPLHYPFNTDLFYGGFEVFVLRDPAQVAVGGIEDGPASRAGVHWGDVILSIDGADLTGKTPAQLESLFSSARPESVRLKIDRAGLTKTVEFTLERASDTLIRNRLRILNGKLVPAGLSDEDARCIRQTE